MIYPDNYRDQNFNWGRKDKAGKIAGKRTKRRCFFNSTEIKNNPQFFIYQELKLFFGLHEKIFYSSCFNFHIVGCLLSN